MKKILQKNARQSIKEGIDLGCDVVKVSMGNYGRNVIIYNGSKTEVINDGVSIINAIKIKEDVHQAGIELAKECAKKTDEEAGDGTTTTLVLLQAVLKEVLSGIETEAPRLVRDRLMKEAEAILKKIKVMKIKSKDDIYNIAYTSSLDSEVANSITNIYEELGEDCQVSIEETSRNVLEVDIQNGVKFESKKAEDKLLLTEDKIVLEDVYVLVTDKVEDVSLVQEYVAKTVQGGGNSLVVVANQFSRPVLLDMIGAKNFTIHPIEYKMFNPIEDLKDYVGEGKLKKVIITGENTTVIGGTGDVTEKVRLLKEKLEVEESQFEKDNIQKRISAMLGKVAIIRVGKNTDVERNEAVLKVEDALGSVRGAYSMGYCKGGGSALYEASRDASEQMQNICEAPYKQIRENAGFDFETPETAIDSFKTVKLSLMNALSTGTSILTSGAALIEYEDEE